MNSTIYMQSVDLTCKTNTELTWEWCKLNWYSVVMTISNAKYVNVHKFFKTLYKYIKFLQTDQIDITDNLTIII